MINRNPVSTTLSSNNLGQRPQITRLNFTQFTEAERKAASDAWRSLALSGEKDLIYAYIHARQEA